MSDTSLNKYFAQGDDAAEGAFTPNPVTGLTPEQAVVFVNDQDPTQPVLKWWDGANWIAMVGAGSGTVTNTGTLTDHALIVGNGTVDVSALGSLGTTTTVLHGNAAGDPTFGAVALAADVSGDLPLANLAQASAASVLLGRGSAGGAGDYQEITVSTGLTMTGTTLTASGGGSGSLVLLATLTASTSATLDFTTISGTYDTYFLDIENLVPDTSTADMNLRCGTGGGPSWDSGSNYNYAVLGYTNLGSTQNFNGSGATTVKLANSLGTSASGGYCGGLWLRNVNSGSAYKSITGNGLELIDSSGNFTGYSTFIGYANTTALTGVRFYFSSGNITSGVIRCYGLTP